MKITINLKSIDMIMLLKTNWYRLIKSVAITIFSIGFFLFAINDSTAKARDIARKYADPPNRWIVANQRGIFEVTFDPGSYPKYKCKLIFNENGK